MNENEGNKSNKYITAVLLILAVIVWGKLLFFGDSVERQADNSRNEIVLKYVGVPLKGVSEITCTYPQLLTASYVSSEITHELPEAETDPFIFTFSDFTDETAKLKYIDSTQTISESELLFVEASEDRVVYAEGFGNHYISLHTIYPDKGVALYSKQVSLLGTPLGSLAMGTCIGY